MDASMLNGALVGVRILWKELYAVGVYEEVG